MVFASSLTQVIFNHLFFSGIEKTTYRKKPPFSFLFNSEEILERITVLLDRHFLCKKGEITTISWPLRLPMYTLHVKVTKPEVTLVVSKFPQLTLPRPLTLSGCQYESGSAEGNPMLRVLCRRKAFTAMLLPGQGTLLQGSSLLFSGLTPDTT